MLASPPFPAMSFARKGEAAHTIIFAAEPFPIVRLPGEPGSVLFTDTYAAALRATNLEGFTALRKQMHEKRSCRFELPTTQAVWSWANRKQMTLEQATMVAKLFAVSVDEITRDREIVSE